MMKEKYTNPECEIIKFSAEDVITTSVVGDNGTQSEYEDFVMSDFG